MRHSQTTMALPKPRYKISLEEIDFNSKFNKYGNDVGKLTLSRPNVRLCCRQSADSTKKKIKKFILNIET